MPDRDAARMTRPPELHRGDASKVASYLRYVSGPHFERVTRMLDRIAREERTVVKKVTPSPPTASAGQ